VYVTDSKDGRKSLGLMADAMIALCYAKIPGFRHEIEMLPDGSAQGKFWRDGWTKPYVTQFGDKEAKAAGLLEKPGAMYNKYKANMYRSRVKADGARFAGPEACMGLYTPEEMGARVTITADGEEMVETSPAVDTETGEVEEAKVEVKTGEEDSWLANLWALADEIKVVKAMVQSQAFKIDKDCKGMPANLNTEGRAALVDWLESKRIGEVEAAA